MVVGGIFAAACKPKTQSEMESSDVASSPSYGNEGFKSSGSPAKLAETLQYEPRAVASGDAYYGIEGVYDIDNIFKRQKINKIELQAGDQVAFLGEGEGNRDCEFIWVGNYSKGLDGRQGFTVTINCSDAQKYLRKVNDAHSCISKVENACSKKWKQILEKIHDRHVRLMDEAKRSPNIYCNDMNQGRRQLQENPYVSCIVREIR